MAPAYWPLFGLVLRTPRLELRPPTDDDFPALIDAIDAGIHDPATMPFLQPWTDVEPGERARRAAQWWWRSRAEWTVEKWSLGFAVFVDGAAVGMQGVEATSFPALRTVASGSWVTQSHQGQGIGTEMRAAVLELAFRGLGAEVAESGAFRDNAPSLGVSRALGYEPNGVRRAAPRGEVKEIIELRLTRDRWRPPVDVEIGGLDACLPMFGLG